MKIELKKGQRNITLRYSQRLDIKINIFYIYLNMHITHTNISVV